MSRTSPAVLIILFGSLACHRGDVRWESPLPDPTASPIPVQLHNCSAFRHKLTIDEDRVLTLHAGEDQLYAKISSTQLQQLEASLQSDTYTRATAAAREDGYIVFCSSNSIVIKHTEQHQMYRFATGSEDDLPETVEEVVRLIDGFGQQFFGDRYTRVTVDSEQ